MLNSSFVWTDDVRAEAVEMWQDGRSLGDIATFFSISRSAVSGYISRNRSLFDRRPPSGPARAKATKLPKPQAPRTRWTDEVIQKASTMWRVGLTAAEISEAVGCSQTAFYEFAGKHRDKFPKRLLTARVKVVAVKPEESTRAIASGHLFDSTGYQLPGVQTIAFVAIGRGECRFPINSHDSHNGPDMACCGAETGGMVYCPAHMSIARGRGTESERTAHRALRRVA